MPLGHPFIAGALLIVPSIALGQPQPVGTIWQSARGSVVVTACPPGGDHDAYCRAVALKSRAGIVKLGTGYLEVKLLWSGRHRSDGPDALILGNDGGSGGNADLFAVSFSPKASFRKLGGERFDTVAVRQRAGSMHASLPFDIEYFNSAPHAGAIVLPLPVVWKAHDFTVDFGALTGRSFTVSDLDFRALAMREELQQWAEESYRSARLYPPDARRGTPVTVTTLVEMMLSGHADQARDLLDRAWPSQWERNDKPLGGKADFWAAVCRAVIAAPLWERFALARLPNADIIEQGAKPKM